MIRASERTGGVSCQVSGRVTLACTAALMTFSAAWGAEQPAERPDPTPQPWVTMSLASLGVPSIPTAFVQSGSSMLTLDMVDDTHLLLTFSSRGLVPRVPGDPPDDEDRMVAAELVELPTARIMARADWHMHDHGRYLWRLGKGRFLVRSRHELFMITPEARLNMKDPLRAIRFPTREGTPVVAVVSADKGLVTVETLAPQKKSNVDAASNGVIVTDPKQVVMIDFYRLNGGDAPGVSMTISGAGVVRASVPLALPMDSDGYLWPSEAKHGQWPVSFNEFGGREVKIVDVASSCPPRLQMVSRFEFLAFTCMGSDARVRLKSYGMDGHETWEETLSGTFGVPELAYAPEAGRFALSRIVSASPDLNFGSVVPDGATQEVRVYQTESGTLLLKVPTAPVTRYAENFDLTEDGMVAAVVNAGEVQVYKLPQPSDQDVKDLTEAKGFSPPASQGPVNFARLAPHGDGGSENSSEGADVAGVMSPDLLRAGSSIVFGGSGGSGGGSSAAAPAPPAATASASGAPPAGGAATPRSVDVTKSSGDGVSAVGADPPVSNSPGPTNVAGADPAGTVGNPGGGTAAKPSAGGDPASSTDGITDAEALAVMAKTGPAAKAEPGTKVEPATRTDASGEAETGQRKRPTLLEPGENVEKVKAPPQQQSQPPTR